MCARRREDFLLREDISRIVLVRKLLGSLRMQQGEEQGAPELEKDGDEEDTRGLLKLSDDVLVVRILHEAMAPLNLALFARLCLICKRCAVLRTMGPTEIDW